jgi:death-on-curing protein
MPQQTFGGEFLHDFPFEMAAAYAFHIAESQGFVDGNKRTGAAAALVFLQLNGWECGVGPWVTDAMLGVAAGALDKKALAIVFERHARRMR